MNAILSKLSSKKSFLNGPGQQLKSLVRMSSTSCVKPPVILVVGNEDKNSTDLLTKIKSLVRSEKYLVYPATSATLAGQLWWQETALLVLNAHLTEETEQAALRKWVQANGKVLDFASNKVCQDDNRGFCFEVGSDKDGELATLLEQKLNIEVAMEEDETPSLTPGFLISSTKEFWDSFPPENSSEGLGLIFRPVPDLMPSVSLVPVLETESPEFDSSLYRETLTTRDLGQVAVYVPCVGSTQSTLEKCVCHGATLIAGRQTEGKGRGGNVWLSPPGCCMFSTQILVGSGKVLASRPSIVQHLAALAVVQAVKETTGVALNIKWPNDIYLRTAAETEQNINLTKMGGVVVAASSNRNGLTLVLGVGINLDNAKPTCSLNRVAEDQEGGGKVGKEKLIASILNHLELLLDMVEAGGWEEVEQEYYKAWLHSNQPVRVTDKEGREEDVLVVGVDKFGFLRVHCDKSGEDFTVFDDGNSFDMMAGLIRPKSRI